MNSHKEVCERCGHFCCLYQLRRIEDKDMDKPNFEFWNARSEKMVDKDGVKFFVLAMPCNKFNGSGCGIYENRPQICRAFPPHYDPDWWHFCELMRMYHKPRKRFWEK